MMTLIYGWAVLRKVSVDICINFKMMSLYLEKQDKYYTIYSLSSHQIIQ